MRRFTLVVFPDERSALRAFHALQELHREGSVRVFAAAVAERDDGGALSVKRRSDAAPLGAGLGALIGSLRSEFLELVERDLAPGRFAVVAELEERWMTPVDRWPQAFGGSPVCAWWKDVGAGAPDVARRAIRGEADAVQRERATSSATRRENVHA
jgi:hypothetical protein